MIPSRASSILKSLRDLRGFTFDLDGTIWEGPKLLPGAAELVADLRQVGLGVVFASNCSRHGSPLLCDQLADLGIAVTPSEVFTPFDLVGEEVRRRLGAVPVLVVGTDDVGRVMESSGTPISRSIAGTRPRRLSSVSTMTSVTIACVRPRARSLRVPSCLPSTWMRVSRSGRVPLILAAGHSPKRSRWRRACGRQRSANPSYRCFRSPSTASAVRATRLPWSATAPPRTSPAAEPPACSRSGSTPKAVLPSPTPLI